MGRFFGLLSVSIILMGFSSGCKEKVDCNKLKSRLTQCMNESYKELNPKGRHLDNPLFKEDANKLAADYNTVIDKYYFDQCESIGGKEKRSEKINMCLRQKTCVGVHECLKDQLK